MGSSDNVSRAVISASRPKAVLNQGIPAYGYGPVGFSVTSMRRSAADLSNVRLNSSSSEEIFTLRAALERSVRLRFTYAARKADLGGAATLRQGVHSIRKKMVARPFGSMSSSKIALPSVSACGTGSNESRVPR